MSTRVAAILLLLLLSWQYSPAQSDSRGSRMDHDADVFVQDAADIFSAPGDFGQADWLRLAVIVGAGVAAYSVDEDVRRHAQENRTEDLDDWLRIGDWYGNGLTGGVLGAGMYGGGLFLDDEWTRVTGRMLLQSQFYSTFVTHVLKILLGRARPHTDEGKSSFSFLRFDNAHMAHPSGHSTSAFAMSATLSRRVGSVPFSIFMYSLATVTALQRIVDDRHWLSDTVIGATIGTVIGIAVVQAEEARAQAEGERLPVSAGFAPHRPLFGLTLDF
jgi:membrane-associated phospholipid phosphatase